MGIMLVPAVQGRWAGWVLRCLKQVKQSLAWCRRVCGCSYCSFQQTLRTGGEGRPGPVLKGQTCRQRGDTQRAEPRTPEGVQSGRKEVSAQSRGP